MKRRTNECCPESAANRPHARFSRTWKRCEKTCPLSDDIWAGIDRQDLAAFDEGVGFMRSYVEKMTEFDRLAADISLLIQKYTQVSLEATEETGREDREQNERIIQELNREDLHTLDEDFTCSRPHGLILGGQATSGITTWQRCTSWCAGSSTSATAPLPFPHGRSRIHQQSRSP